MDFSKKVDVSSQNIYVCLNEIDDQAEGHYGWVLKASSILEDPLNLNNDWFYGEDCQKMSKVEEDIKNYELKDIEKTYWLGIYDHTAKLIYVIAPKSNSNKLANNFWLELCKLSSFCVDQIPASSIYNLVFSITEEEMDLVFKQGNFFQLNWKILLTLCELTHERRSYFKNWQRFNDSIRELNIGNKLPYHEKFHKFLY
jgi:hypothetical protein